MCVCVVHGGRKKRSWRTRSRPIKKHGHCAASVDSSEDAATSTSTSSSSHSLKHAAEEEVSRSRGEPSRELCLQSLHFRCVSRALPCSLSLSSALCVCLCMQAKLSLHSVFVCVGKLRCLFLYACKPSSHHSVFVGVCKAALSCVHSAYSLSLRCASLALAHAQRALLLLLLSLLRASGLGLCSFWRSALVRSVRF